MHGTQGLLEDCYTVDREVAVFYSMTVSSWNDTRAVASESFWSTYACSTV